MKGFTLLELLAVIVILAIVILIAVPVIFNLIEQFKINVVSTNVKLLDNALDMYILNNDSSMPTAIGQTVEVTLLDLQSEKYIGEIRSPFNDNLCSGYVLITKTENGFTRDPHLNCLANIDSSNDDKLILNYTFDDFQESTSNLINNMVVGGHGSSYTLQSFLYNQSPVYRNSVTLPNSGNNFGFRSSTSTLLDPNGPRMLTISFDNKINTTPGPMTGYVRVRYTDASEFNHFWNYNPSNWHALDASDYKKVVGTVNLTPGKTPERIVVWYVYKDNAPAGDMLISNIQIEQKAYNTPYVSSVRTGVVKDYSINNNTSTLNISTTPRWLQDEKSNKGFYLFNGLGNYISVDNSESINLNTSATISLFVKTDRLFPSDSATTAYRGIVSKTVSGGTGGQSFYLDWYGSNATRSLRAAIGDATGSEVININNFMFTQKWTHLVFTFNENSMQLYSNGVKIGERTKTKIPQSLTSKIEIGRAFNNNVFSWEGSLDEVRIYSRALSEKEVQILYETTKK